MRFHFIIGLSAALLLASCTRNGVEEVTRVQVPLSFLVREMAPVQTKTTDAMAQSGSAENQFRGISEITFLPFARQGAVQATDERLGFCDPLEALSADLVSHFVLYEKKTLPRDAASFLFYGKASPGEVTDIWKTGTLVVNGLNGKNPAGISFAPQQIAPDAADATKKTKLVNYLNTLANSSVNQVAGLATFANTYPQEYAYLTNNGQLMAGTSTGIKSMLDAIYTAINKKAASDLKTKILNNLVNTSYGVSRDAQRGIILPETMSSYPGANLPNGAAALRWDGSKFVLGDDASLYMPAHTRYCYPIPLWYYANTTIRTTENKAKTYAALTPYYTGSTTWDTVLAQYEKNPGKVRPETIGVALENPVQYGVAQLALTLEAISTDNLQDEDGTKLSVKNTNFPVTALIVGGQRIQDFNFTPMEGSEDYLVYDNQFTGTAYLSKTQPEVTLRCLVLETAPSTPVYLAMEVQNNSGKAFKGATGWVLPGAKFYLTGRLDLSDADSPGNGKIFERSCLTTARVFVSSLKKAYNVIPDLRDPQMQVGFTVRLDWDFNTPINTPLK